MGEKGSFSQGLNNRPARLNYILENIRLGRPGAIPRTFSDLSRDFPGRFGKGFGTGFLTKRCGGKAVREAEIRSAVCLEVYRGPPR